MLLSEKLYSHVKPIWDSYYNHPFVKGIGDGSLDISKFKFYMIQDYLYLLDYAKVFALGIVKSDDEKIMQGFSNSVNTILNGEMSIHRSYMSLLGITEEDIKNAKMSITNKSYTTYMLWVSNNYGLLDLLVSILSCAWSYEMIGVNLSKIENSINHKFYGNWIKGYSSNEYIESTKWIIDLVNTLGQDISDEKLNHLKEIFENCSRYEYMFWDMSFNEEL